MDTKPINEFDPNDIIEGYFAVRKAELRDYTRGKFLSAELGDASGRINAVMWEPDQFALTELTEGLVVKVRGTVSQYKGKNQLVINRIRLAVDNEFELTTILPHSPQSREHRLARLTALGDKVENSYIKSLIDSFFDDEEFMSSFLNAAAGKLWHHATIGGLSEHTANVTELALRVASGYDFLNKDYLVFGGLFHDAGKIGTYTADSTVIDYTDQGRLVGHICLCDQWICRRAEDIEGFPPALLTKLRHMILSHHGELAYAAPVVPQLPEAFVLYYCDEIDSKMGAIERIRSRQGGEGWSEYVKMLGRFLYFDCNSEDQKE
ncbi:MAG: OB-fold nucleic acid binding domain-containing protein [candidate division Zixibacteria bacterium]